MTRKKTIQRATFDRKEQEEMRRKKPDLPVPGRDDYPGSHPLAQFEGQGGEMGQGIAPPETPAQFKARLDHEEALQRVPKDSKETKIAGVIASMEAIINEAVQQRLASMPPSASLREKEAAKFAAESLVLFEREEEIKTEIRVLIPAKVRELQKQRKEIKDRQQLLHVSTNAALLGLQMNLDEAHGGSGDDDDPDDDL